MSIPVNAPPQEGRDELANVVRDMREKALLVRRNSYGNELAVARLVNHWADILDVLASPAAPPAARPAQFDCRVECRTATFCEHFKRCLAESLPSDVGLTTAPSAPREPVVVPLDDPSVPVSLVPIPKEPDHARAQSELAAAGDGRDPVPADAGARASLRETVAAARPPVVCLDCGLPYAQFPLDVSMPDADWRRINPSRGGVLCAGCIVKRAATFPDVIVVAARLRTSDEYDEPVVSPRQEFELAIGRGVPCDRLSPECIRAIRNAVPFDPAARPEESDLRGHNRG